MNIPTRQRPCRTGPRHSAGATLIVGMILLLLLTGISLTSLKAIKTDERLAGNLQDRHVAFQAAEAALREAEGYLDRPSLPPAVQGKVYEYGDPNNPGPLELHHRQRQGVRRGVGRDRRSAALHHRADERCRGARAERSAGRPTPVDRPLPHDRTRLRRFSQYARGPSDDLSTQRTVIASEGRIDKNPTSTGHEGPPWQTMRSAARVFASAADRMSGWHLISISPPGHGPREPRVGGQRRRPHEVQP